MRIWIDLFKVMVLTIAILYLSFSLSFCIQNEVLFSKLRIFHRIRYTVKDFVLTLKFAHLSK